MTPRGLMLDIISNAPTWWCDWLLCGVFITVSITLAVCAYWITWEIILPCLERLLVAIYHVFYGITWLFCQLFNPDMWIWFFIVLCSISIIAMGGQVTLREGWWKK